MILIMAYDDTIHRPVQNLFDDYNEFLVAEAFFNSILNSPFEFVF